MASAASPSSLNAFRNAVEASLRLDSSCVPDATVVTTMVDATQAVLRKLQFARVAQHSCLMCRTVSLCWNYTDTYGTCVAAEAAPFSAKDFPSMVNSDAAYFRITWTKWHLLRAALQAAHYALFIDADVVLLSNPFVVEPVQRLLANHALKSDNWSRVALRSEAHLDAAAPRAPVGRVDSDYGQATRRVRARLSSPMLLYQYEGAGSNPLNSGQLLASSSGGSSLAVRAVLAEQPHPHDVLAAARLEQEVAFSALRRWRVPLAQLPRTFAGNCWWGPEVVPPCDLVTFHAHCTASVGQKIERMTLVLRETARCRHETRVAVVAERAHASRRRLHARGGHRAPN